MREAIATPRRPRRAVGALRGPGAMLDDSDNRTLVAAADAALPRRRRASEAGLFLVLVAAPLVVVPSIMQPYFAPKLVVVAAAAFLFALDRTLLASELRLPVLAWVSALAVAAGTGVDAWQSLLGRQQAGNGLVLAVACAALLLAGNTLPGDLQRRVPRWLVAAGLCAALLGIAASLMSWVARIVAGSQLGSEGWGLPPLGHPVYLGTLCAAAAAATVPLARRKLVLASVIMAILVSGIAAGGKRTALLGFGVALLTPALRDRLPLRRLAVLAVVSVLTISGWVAISQGSPVADGSRYEEIINSTARDRLTVWQVSARAWADRPITGWGPANTSGAVFSTATEPEARIIGRLWQDAHNFFVETAVTAGALGVAALVWLVVAVGRRMRRGPSWALGAAAALLVHHLFQPVHVVLTPLLFLLAGLVAAGAPKLPDRGPRATRWPVVAVLGAGLMLSSLRFVASGLEANGRLYFRPDLGTVRAAVALDPSAQSASAFLAEQLALDVRARPGARAEVRALTARLVDQHPWDLLARLHAARAELIMGDAARAAWWIDRHLKLFPYDGYALALRAVAALRGGDVGAADRFLARSIEIEPGGFGAQIAWDRAVGKIPRAGG